MCGKKCLQESQKLPLYRITPACAGKSDSDGVIIVKCWDHPRMCGEKSNSPLGSLTTMGSPPHVRGKVAESTVDILGVRITPACAGKSTIIYGDRHDV